MSERSEESQCDARDASSQTPQHDVSPAAVFMVCGDSRNVFGNHTGPSKKEFLQHQMACFANDFSGYFYSLYLF